MTRRLSAERLKNAEKAHKELLALLKERQRKLDERAASAELAGWIASVNARNRRLGLAL